MRAATHPKARSAVGSAAEPTRELHPCEFGVEEGESDASSIDRPKDRAPRLRKRPRGRRDESRSDKGEAGGGEAERRRACGRVRGARESRRDAPRWPPGAEARWTAYGSPEASWRRSRLRGKRDESMRPEGTRSGDGRLGPPGFEKSGRGAPPAPSRARRGATRRGPRAGEIAARAIRIRRACRPNRHPWPRRGARNAQSARAWWALRDGRADRGRSRPAPARAVGPWSRGAVGPWGREPLAARRASRGARGAAGGIAGDLVSGVSPVASSRASRGTAHTAVRTRIDVMGVPRFAFNLGGCVRATLEGRRAALLPGGGVDVGAGLARALRSAAGAGARPGFETRMDFGRVRPGAVDRWSRGPRPVSTRILRSPDGSQRAAGRTGAGAGAGRRAANRGGKRAEDAAKGDSERGRRAGRPVAS